MIQDFNHAMVLAGEGDDEGIAWLYDAYHHILLRYLRWRDPREADDIESDVWLAVAQNIKRFKGDEPHFKSWLFTIARRRVIDMQRKRARNKVMFVAPETLYAHGSGSDTVQEAMESLSAQQAVSELVAGLPRDQAEVIILRVLGGLDTREVAEITGKRPGTIRVLQHRALQQMAGYTGRQGGGDSESGGSTGDESGKTRKVMRKGEKP